MCGLPPLSAQAGAQCLEAVLAQHQQRLPGRLQQVVERAGIGPRVDVQLVDQQRDRSVVTERLEEPDAEVLSEGCQDLADPLRREPAASQLGERRQLVEVDRRVAPLGEAARRGWLRGHARRQKLTRVPPLQLSGGQPGQRRHLARAVALL